MKVLKVFAFTLVFAFILFPQTIGRGNIWVNRLGFSPEEKQTQRLASHILTQSQPLLPSSTPSCKEMPLMACRACSAAHPQIIQERTKTAGKGELSTKLSIYLSPIS